MGQGRQPRYFFGPPLDRRVHKTSPIFSPGTSNKSPKILFDFFAPAPLNNNFHRATLAVKRKNTAARNRLGPTGRPKPRRTGHETDRPRGSDRLTMSQSGCALQPYDFSGAGADVSNVRDSAITVLPLPSPDSCDIVIK